MGGVLSAIAQGVKPVVIDPSEYYFKQQQLQAGQQQAQMNALKLKQAQVDLADNETLKGLSAEYGGDFEKALADPRADSISPGMRMSLTKSLIENKDKIADTDKKRADAQESMLKAQDSEKELIASWALGHQAANSSPAAVITSLGPLVQKFPDWQQHAAAIQQHLSQNPNDLPQILTELTAGSKVGQTAQERKAQGVTAEARQQEAGTAASKETREASTADIENLERKTKWNAGALADAAKQGPEALALKLNSLTPEERAPFQGMTKPEDFLQAGMTAADRVKEAREAAMQQQTITHREALEKTATQRVGIEAGRLALEKQRAGFEQGGGVSETAKAIASGTLDPATTRAMLRRSPGIINQVMQVDPEFDEANIEKRFKTLQEFTNTSNSKAGGQALALNTMIHHADLYLDAADALKNGTFKPGNAAYNTVATMMGSAPPNNAALVARFLAGETGKVATGGVPAESEVRGILSTLGTNASPEQMHEAGQKLMEIASGRATPLMEKVKDAKLDKVVSVLGPDAKTILAKRGFNPETMKPIPAGTAPTQPTKRATAAHVQDYAKQKGISVDQATKEFKDAGYRIQ